jgi:hypothetical protein
LSSPSRGSGIRLGGLEPELDVPDRDRVAVAEAAWWCRGAVDPGAVRGAEVDDAQLEPDGRSSAWRRLTLVSVRWMAQSAERRW